ncbi:hypothetical protein QBC43DRAFT_325015 [Cladorrhinum sp. PSN259]|nr:hypothetical protein QBC43DRAFT_325015 [Cladorrhinum sp. PSN259]
MSFGYAVGDVVAVLGLFERIAIEIRSYRDGPNHFQQLQAELEMHRTTIQSILTVEPTCLKDFVIVQRIRAIALHCRLPLQQFLDQMHGKEQALGNFRTARGLTAIGTRLHWSLIGKKDVDELRNTLLSRMLAINLLQGQLQVLQIQRLGPEMNHFAKVQSRDLAKFAHEIKILRDTAEETPRAISDLRMLVEKDCLDTTQHLGKIDNKLKVVESNIKKLFTDAFSVVAIFGKGLGERVGTALSQILDLMVQLRKMMEVLSKTSQTVLEAVSKTTSILLDLRNNMRSLAQSIDSIPLHLKLPLIRFDDALGESWAIPFQACTTWQAFTEMLKAVIFREQRPGFHRVINNQFVLKIAKSHRDIPRWEWEKRIEPGMHIEQWMNVPELVTDLRGCPFPECDGTFSDILKTLGGGMCLKCDRSTISRKQYQNLITVRRPEYEGGQILSSDQTQNSSEYQGEKRAAGPFQLPKIESPDKMDDIKHFRRVQYQQPVEAVNTLEEAEEILRVNATEPRANQFMGWYKLSIDDDPYSAVQYLQTASDWHGTDFYNAEQSNYLLGRAYMALRQFPKAYESYEKVMVDTDPRCHEYWISIAILYYRIFQHRDSLDALAKAIRLYPFDPRTWMNLGILYDSVHQFEDSTDCFSRCLELSPVSESHYARSRLSGDIPPPDFNAEYQRPMVEPALEHVNKTILAPRNSSKDINLNPIQKTANKSDY